MNEYIENMISNIRNQIREASSEADTAIDYATDARDAANLAVDKLDDLVDAFNDIPETPELDIEALTLFVNRRVEAATRSAIADFIANYTSVNLQEAA